MWQNNSKLHTSLKQNKTSPWILDKQISRAKMQTAKWNRRQWGWEWSQYYPRACLSDYPLNIPLVRIYISKLMETGAVHMCCLLALDHNRITLARREPGKLCKFLFCMYFSMKCYFSIIRKFTHESSWSSGSVYLQILQHEATESISTPLERDASPSQSYPSIKFVGTHWYTWVERSTVRGERGTVREVSWLKSTAQYPRPKLESEPLSPETSALTMKPPRLPSIIRTVWDINCHFQPMHFSFSRNRVRLLWIIKN